jgi:hypothetical protein
LNIKGGENMTKHIHKFRSLLEILLAWEPIFDDEVMLSLLRSMLTSSLRQWPNLTIQALIIDLLHEEIMMLSLNFA